MCQAARGGRSGSWLHLGPAAALREAGHAAAQGCQNRDSIIRFYDFTIQINLFDSMILLSKIYVSTILIVKIP